MLSLRWCIALLLAVSAGYGASFGTVVPVTGGASDLVIDEPRGRLYLINPNTNRVEVYSIPQRRFLNPITVEAQPLAAALSRDNRILYVTCHAASSLVEVDLETLGVRNRVSLPARPEGVAVGGDGRVLISTVGTGQNNLFNVLLVYSPVPEPREQSIAAVPIQPPAAANPLLPPNNFGRGGLINRSFLETSRDGKLIIGMNLPNAQARAVFVYEVASRTVLRSRTIAGVSSVLTVSPDGTKFMAGLTLFDTATLTVLAQQNAANAPYLFAPGTNFNLQQNQGGSVFTPDGSKIYSAFNFAPVQNPPVRPNVSQLMINDPDNLLIDGAYQLNENIAGKMDITEDGSNIFALSESGFLIIPVGQANENPIATVDNVVSLLANDQCGATGPMRATTVTVRNAGRGRLTAQAQLIQQPAAGPAGLGGVGGPGGEQVGGAIIIQIPVPPAPGAGAGGAVGGGGGVGGGAAALPNNAANNTAATAPRMQTRNTADGTNVEFSFNPINRSVGTVTPAHQFSIVSQEAINIPAAVRVFQNVRNADSRGDILPIEVGTAANEGLVDMVTDQARRRLYVANSGKNRVEVIDTRNNTLMAPIKVGQLPRSLAISADGLYLYVANNGAETISIVDLDRRETVGRVRFPPTPFNNNAALVRPESIATTTAGPLVMMSDGTIWKVIGDEARPRRFNTNVLPANNQGNQIVAAPRTMASAPSGEAVMVLAGNGFAYLYDSNVDDFVATRQVITAPITGYYGPVAVGPRGQYFLVNGVVLNSSLTPIANAGTTTAAGVQVRPGQTPPAVSRPVAAVASIGNTQFARYVPPALANANVLVQGLTGDAATVEIVEVATGRTMAQAAVLERPITAPTGNQRANVTGRQMSVDLQSNTAYILTASGLSIAPLTPINPQSRPAVSQNGVVNVASYTTQVAPGGLVSIFGRGLGASSQANSTPLPTTLGGVCVTLNEQPLPLLLTSADQINAQLPPTLAAGRYPLIVRSIDNKVASGPSLVTVTKYAPAVFMDNESKSALIYHGDGKLVTKENPARRDRPLVMFATGLGLTKGGAVTAGNPAPSSPLAVTDAVKVYFGDPRLAQSEVIVDWSGLVPGYVGLYQLNLRVPGFHGRGDALPVSITIGGVSSPITGNSVPLVAVD